MAHADKSHCASIQKRVALRIRAHHDSQRRIYRKRGRLMYKTSAFDGERRVSSGTVIIPNCMYVSQATTIHPNGRHQQKNSSCNDTMIGLHVIICGCVCAISMHACFVMVETNNDLVMNPAFHAAGTTKKYCWLTASTLWSTILYMFEPGNLDMAPIIECRHCRAWRLPRLNSVSVCATSPGQNLKQSRTN